MTKEFSDQAELMARINHTASWIGDRLYIAGGVLGSLIFGAGRDRDKEYIVEPPDDGISETLEYNPDTLTITSRRATIYACTQGTSEVF